MVLIIDRSRQLDNFYKKNVYCDKSVMSLPKNLQDCYFYYYSVCRKVCMDDDYGPPDLNYISQCDLVLNTTPIGSDPRNILNLEKTIEELNFCFFFVLFAFSKNRELAVHIVMNLRH